MIDLEKAVVPLFSALCTYEGASKWEINIDTYLRFASEYDIIPSICPSIFKLKQIFSDHVVSESDADKKTAVILKN